MSATTKRRNAWNTYKVTMMTYDIGDQQSAGGRHHHEVRKTPQGWARRIRQTNMQYQFCGAPESISEDEGERLFSAAEQY